MVIRSPWLSCFSWTDSPLTKVPLVLPRSTTQNCWSRRSSRAWWPLVAGSRKITSLSGERPIRTAWSAARWVWPASGPVSMVSSPCGPAATLEPACGLAGMAMVSATGGGAVGGGCQAGINVVGSRSASIPLIGGATIVAATSAPSEFALGGGGGDCAPAARSASVEGAAGADAAGPDQTGAGGTFHGGGAASTGGFTASGCGAAGALHEGDGGAAGSSVLGMSHAAGAAGSPHAALAVGWELAGAAGTSQAGATVGGGGAAGAAAQSAVLIGGT